METKQPTIELELCESCGQRPPHPYNCCGAELYCKSCKRKNPHECPTVSFEKYDSLRRQSYDTLQSVISNTEYSQMMNENLIATHNQQIDLYEQQIKTLKAELFNYKQLTKTQEARINELTANIFDLTSRQADREYNEQKAKSNTQEEFEELVQTVKSARKPAKKKSGKIAGKIVKKKTTGKRVTSRPNNLRF